MSFILAWLISLTSLHLALDFRVRDRIQQMAADEYYFTDSVVLDIDDESLRQLEPHIGTWPYNRGIYARLLDYLSEKGAKAVVFDIIFSDQREQDEDFYRSVLKNKIVFFAASSPVGEVTTDREDIERLKYLSLQPQTELPYIEMKSVILPRSGIVGRGEDGAGIGVVTAASDPDGILRRLPLIYRVNDYFLPSLTLRIAEDDYNKTGYSYNPDHGVLTAGKLQLPVGTMGTLHVYFPENANSILALPFFEVAQTALGITDVDDEGFFQGKTVFIGSTAYLSDRVNTPRGSMSGTYVLAIAHETINKGLALKPDKKIWNIILVCIALFPGLFTWLKKDLTHLHLIGIPILAGIAALLAGLGLMAFFSQKTALLFPLEILLLSTFISFVYHQVMTKKFNRMLTEDNAALASAARTDTLTGLFNRRAFHDEFYKEIKTASRHNRRPPCVALMDLDHFKQVNDTHGHDIGDEVLKVFARVLNEGIRATDTCCRWGGEEFAVLFPETDPGDAAIVLERIRSGISRENIESPAGELTVTVSIGIAEIESLEDPIDRVMKNADDALYKAKEEGRNRIIVYNSTANSLS